MSSVYLHTIAYNAEKTIHRCVESIMNQTYQGKLDWHILDNGSTDHTLRILTEYEQNYAFIHVYHIEKNCTPQNDEENELWNQFCRRIHLNLEDNDFYCTLDSDDAYKPDFLKKMTAFMNQYNLDIAAAGNDFINALNGEVMNVRKVNSKIILADPNAYSDHFIDYHGLMRPVWGKLYKGFTLKNYIRNESLTYGSDTYFVFHTLCQASKVGILNESLYQYYLNPKSASYKWDNNRIMADRILDDTARAFLMEKAGWISPDNDVFATILYFCSVLDTLNVILNSNIPVTVKINNILDIMRNRKTQKAFETKDIYIHGYDKKMRPPVVQFLLSQKERRKPDIAETVAEIILAMYSDLQKIVRKDALAYIIAKMPDMVGYLLQKDYMRILERLCKWYKRHHCDVPSLTELEITASLLSGKSDAEMFMLFADIHKNRPQSSKQLDINERISRLLETIPILKNMSPNLAAAIPSAIRWAINHDYKQALHVFLSANDLVINDDDAEAYILFGQNLSAAAEDTGGYLYFKKVWISYLLDCSRTKEARKELDDFSELLPDDEDFIVLRKRLDEAGMTTLV